MFLRKKILITLTFFAVAFTILAPDAQARGNEFDAICKHLKTEYQAKKVKIPFIWAARAFVGVFRPAGVKSFKVTMFKNLKFSPETLNQEMKLTMRNSFSSKWTPILRVRSAKGDQLFMNMRESGKNLKILLVSIQKDEAVVVRAKFNPDKLVKFIDNPKFFGISLDGKDNANSTNIKIESGENSDKVIYEDDENEDEEGEVKTKGKLEEKTDN